MTEKKFLLFDFDGVIADSYGAAFAVSKKICKRITDTDYKRAFERNVHDWDWNSTPGDHSECEHTLDWFTEYTPSIQKDVLPYDGIGKILEAFSKEYTLIIISSTTTNLIQNFLEKFDLNQYVTEVLGADIHPRKTEKITMVFEKYSTAPERCVFITDSLGDMREADAVEVGSIGVVWGWHTTETLEKGNPFRIVNSPFEILPAVSDYFARKQ